ncbi:transposase [Azospirillum sp. A29]|uniref:transposase n=1 Tax=Azospirillum sp. A29 TaxID=3160606 RepID=UPI00366CF9F2
MTTTRRIFTDEFKHEAVALSTSSGRSLAQIARELGLQPSVLPKWQRRLTGSGGRRCPPSSKRRPPLTAGADQASEIARLKRELARGHCHAN